MRIPGTIFSDVDSPKLASPTPLVCTTTALIHKGHLLLGYAIPRIDKLGRKLDGGWQMPGGKVNPDEQLDEGAAREVKEEVGIEIEPWKLRLFAILRMDDFVTFCYLTDLSVMAKPKDMEPEKNRDWQWFKMRDVELALGHQPGEEFVPAGPLKGWVPYPLFPPLNRLLGTGRRERCMRPPGAPTHCMICLEQLPCRHFRSDYP